MVVWHPPQRNHRRDGEGISPLWEGGTVTDPAELLHPKYHQPKHLDPQLSELPTIFELERQMRSTTPGKAMGFDMVPPELLHGSSRRLAYIAWPLFLRQNLTGIECLQHKGGRLASGFKRKGSLQRCENHRALLVSSSLSKAFHGTFRRRTVPYVQAIAGRTQITSHATPNVTMAATPSRSQTMWTQRVSPLSRHYTCVLSRTPPTGTGRRML